MPRFIRIQDASTSTKRPDIRLINIDHITDAVMRHGPQRSEGGRDLCERCSLTLYLTSTRSTSIAEDATAEAREIALYDAMAESMLEYLSRCGDGAAIVPKAS